MEGGVRAAVDDTTSVTAVKIRHEFQKRRSDRQVSQTRARDLPQTTPKHTLAQEEALEGPRGALGGSGGALGEPWEALGEPAGGSGGALGELWEALYIENLPINRTSGRYVIHHL